MCGLIQAQYAFHNISHKSYVTVKYFIKMARSVFSQVFNNYLVASHLVVSYLAVSYIVVGNLLIRHVVASYLQ